MDSKPITLIVQDPPETPAVAVPLWASVSIIAAAAVAAAGVYAGVRRCSARQRDPYADAFDRMSSHLRLSPALVKTVRGLARDDRHALALLVSSGALSDAVDQRLELPATKRDARGLAELLTTMNGVA